MFIPVAIDLYVKVGSGRGVFEHHDAWLGFIKGEA